jgi:hypothetical protein
MAGYEPGDSDRQSAAERRNISPRSTFRLSGAVLFAVYFSIPMACAMGYRSSPSSAGSFT